ncbi:MAG: 16S rRNA (cytidine(1402)-2'-O)-methyltransferase [Thermoleophilia bacterium]
MSLATGKLFVTATPIGNLEDITLRALRVLKEADLIAAEDTRVTRKLLAKYEIKTPLVSLYEHNEKTRIPELLAKIRSGLKIAQVSDAGMPGISDPGYRLIKSCLDEGLPVEIIPGPTALINALVASGLPTDRFLFVGFLPPKSGGRRKLLEELKGERGTLVFYESPHRVKKALADVAEIMGDRPVAMARELTKMFEETIRGTAADILDRLGEKNVKGEIVLVIGGKTRKQ